MIVNYCCKTFIVHSTEERKGFIVFCSKTGSNHFEEVFDERNLDLKIFQPLRELKSSRFWCYDILQIDAVKNDSSQRDK